MTDKELRAIEKRNRNRIRLRAAFSGGEWVCDSFAFLEQERAPKAKQIGILVRPRDWFDSVNERYPDLLDEVVGGRDRRSFQPYHDAKYVEACFNEPSEDDVAKLIFEVRRLRRLVETSN